jgi:hypothetical protein
MKYYYENLSVYGIQGIAGQWVKSYLHYGKQQVEGKSANSNYITYSHQGIIKHGVPQGSVLGSLCFLTHFSNLLTTINL